MCVCVCVCVCALFGSIAGQQARILPSVTVVKWLVALECHRVFFFSFSFFFLGSRLGLDYQSTLGISASLAERAMALGCRELPQAGLFAKLLTDGHRRVVCQSGKA